MTREAFEALMPATNLFPKEAEIFYNLACYSSLLGNLEGAKDWLKTSFKLAAKSGSSTLEKYRKTALNDSKLSPIQKSIPQMVLLSKMTRFF